MFSEIIKEYDIVTLKDKGFLRDEWFIGSALMAHDYENLSEGIYFYSQETIWTRVLELEHINPYWEIYNQTYNFLLVNSQDSLIINFLTKLLKEIEAVFSKKLDFVIITSNEQLVSNLIDRDYSVINKFYLKLLDYFFHGKTPEKFKSFESNFNFNVENSFSEFIDSQENIRVVSLFDCLIQLSSNHIEISGNYKGHIVKKILKKFALYSVITKLDIMKASYLLKTDYFDFIMREINNITTTYPKLIHKYPKDVLSDRYGITNEVYSYLTGENLLYKDNHKSDEVRYFTDIPFIDTPLSIEEFDQIVSKILKIKIGG